MATILITHGVPAEGFAALKGHDLLYPGEGKVFSREELYERLPLAEAVLACGAMDEELIRQGQELKIIVCYGAGYEAIDVAAATRQGVLVANTPDAVTEVTAELAMALILCLSRRVCELNALMHGEEPREAFGIGKRMGTSLTGGTLGIVGMGRIGARVADFGRFMGMKVMYTARTPKPEQDALGARRVPLAELMGEADVVSLHCPHTPETAHMISRELLFSMKSTAFFINTARGRVVDEAALIDALRQGKIAGAGLDVFLGEPDVNEAFAKLPNAVLTPHIGSNTMQARALMGQAASRRILDALEGRRPECLLNPEALKA